MAARANARVLVVDLDGLAALGEAPTNVGRVVCLFEASPARQEDLRARFPGADVVAVRPSGDGPWQTRVEGDLEALCGAPVTAEGVPLLDCFRAGFREDLARMRAMEWALGGAREVAVAAGSDLLPALRALRDRGALDDVHPWGNVRRQRRGWVAKVRRAGPRGLAMALTSRVDPTGARRAALRRRLRLGSAATLLVSSYVNPTRAALEALAALGDGPAILLQSGPGASAGIGLPAHVRPITMPAAVTLDRSGTESLRDACLPPALAALDAPDGARPGWPVKVALARTRLGAALRRVLLPEVVTAVGAIGAVLRATGARRIVVGDEFSFVDRAALHAARALGLETVSRQHGVLDSHYLRDRILAHRHLVWDEATARWLAEHRAVGDRSVEVVPRDLPPGPARRSRPLHVAVFLQPFQLIGVAPSDWLAETVPAVLRAADEAGLALVLKPHPLQTAVEVRADLPPSVRTRCHLVTDRTAREILADAAAAVTLDSSVAVDCREAGVPCLSTGWYEGTYREDLVRLGYVDSVPTPEALEAALKERLATARR